MRRLLIVWHSRTGGAEKMAKTAAQAATQVATEAAIEVVLRPAAEATGADLIDADGYLFVAPENLASLSGVMKDFFDRAYYDALDRIQGRPYALMVCAGSDGSGAVRQMQRIATGWRLRQIGEPLIVITGAQTGAAIWAPKTIANEELARCATVGEAFAEGLAAGIF
jgi:multimeric flavodoxin WrbA